MSPYLVSATLTTEFDIAESSHNYPTQVNTVPRQQAERKRKRPASGVSIHQGQLASETDTLSTIPHDILDKWNRIASPEALTQLWHCLWAKRGSPSNKEPESIFKTSDPSDTSIEGQLRRYQLQYQKGSKGTLKKHKQLANVPWRLYLANIIGFYLQVKAARKDVKQRRKRNRGRNLDAANTPRKSVYDIFVDFLLPELLKEDGDMREEARRRFDNWIQHGKRWAKLVECFGLGILLLIPQDLSNEK